tara:strand:+ start:59 stop:325 length:267 start_codon:yes stop_codon:yes gene_type:complete
MKIIPWLPTPFGRAAGRQGDARRKGPGLPSPLNQEIVSAAGAEVRKKGCRQKNNPIKDYSKYYYVPFSLGAPSPSLRAQGKEETLILE